MTYVGVKVVLLRLANEFGGTLPLFGVSYPLAHK